jgi:hypothetical protein
LKKIAGEPSLLAREVHLNLFSLQVALCSPTLGRLATLLRKSQVAPNVRSIHWCRPQITTFTMTCILRRAAALDSALGHSGLRSGVAVCEMSPRLGMRRLDVFVVWWPLPRHVFGICRKHNRGRAVAARPRSAF